MAGAQAQEQFFTQSGGQGLQNAKTNARLSRMENNVDTLNKEMADIKPHAKAELGACSDDGEKLRYDGNNWICQQETDPTVQAFAKQPLPSCSGGNILGVQGGNLGCVSAGFVTNETDPTVQSFAKQPLPNCGSEQNLTVQNGELKCLDDQVGVTIEKDPYVHDFARTDVTPVLPNCSASQVLTMMNGALVCKTDDVGISEEVDPFTASFARTDISGYSLAACGTGETLTSVANSDGKIILQCQSASDSLAEALALNDLSDVDTTGETSGTVLMFDGTSWKPLPEQDPNVQGWARTGYTLATCNTGEVLTYDGTKLSCVADAGGDADPLTLAGLADVDVASVADGQFLKYNGTSTKWEPGTVEEFAQTVLPTCTSGQVLTGDGTNLNCTNDAGGASDPLNLVELGDVRTGPGVNLVPTDKDLLRWDSGSSKWLPVHDKLSGTLTSSKWCYYDGTNVVCDRGAPLTCGTGEMLHWDSGSSAFDCVSGTSALGLGSMAYQDADNVAITGGKIDGTVIGGTTPADGHFTNLYANGILSTGPLLGGSLQVSSAVIQGNGVVTGDWTILGNLNVSGSQSIDGVVFANGGVSATGIISATGFSGDGSGLTNVQASSVDWYNVTRIPTPVQEVSNSGAIVMAGISSTNVSVTDNLTVGSLLTTGGLTVSGQSQLGAVSATTLETSGNTTVDGDLWVKGNFFVSGSQSIDGVIFANGGVSATGIISATGFSGDGSGLTNVQASGVDWYDVSNIPAQVKEVSDSGAIVMAGISSTNVSVTTNLSVGGALTAGTMSTGGLTVSGASQLANVSATVGDFSGLVTMANGHVLGDLTVDGNLNVSGSQSIDGVIFANGGVSATGTISATGFVGDGSGLTGITGAQITMSIDDLTDARSNAASGTVFLGSGSGNANTAGNNTGLGINALNANTTGDKNTAIGNGAMQLNGDGYENTATGYQALYSSHSGSSNVANGNGALYSNTDGSGNVAVGYQSLYKNTTSGDMVAVGYQALYNNTSGYQNTATGEFALHANTSGYANSAYGNSALSNNTTGNQNAAFGHSALSGGTGNNNAALGWKAGWQTSTGSNNTFVGALAGQNNYTGGSNIAIGYGVTLPTSSTSNSLNIGNSIFGDMTSAAAGVGGAANIGINWVTPTVALEVSGTVSATHLVGDGSGLTGITAAGLGAAGVTGSVQFKGASGEISGTDTLVWDNANANLAVSGTMQVAGSGAACSGNADTGKMRVVDIGSGDFRMEFCRP